MVHDEPIAAGYGAESYVRRLVDGLRAAGDEVDVLAGEIRHDGMGRVRDLWDPAARGLVDRRAQSFLPHVVHFHNIARELSPSVLAAAPSVPAVMTVHDFRLLGGYEHGRLTARGQVGRMVAGRIRRRSTRRLAATIGVSERVSATLRRHDFPRVSTVRVPALRPASTPHPVTECDDVAVVARLARDKGVDVAIDAFAGATADEPGGRRLLIAGDGPERKQLESRSRHLGDRVEFLGRLDETGVSALLGRVRAVIVASQPQHRPEGSSLALVEAAMHGRPVVASDDPAVGEVAADLGNALLVQGHDGERFSRALRRLLDDAALAADLGSRGQHRAEELHAVDAVTAATRAVYESVAGRAAS
jgi:glycosyltransferase involved in cell wall biosynthesis